MLRPFIDITIQQIPTPLWKDRNLSFKLDFVTDYEIESDWETHTNNCTLKFPKNISLFGTPNAIFVNNGTWNVNPGGSGTDKSPNVNMFGQDNTKSPLLMKGDIITINHGYIIRNENGVESIVSTGNSKGNNLNLPIAGYLSTTNDLFKGYIRSVKSSTPIEIEIEDHFYLLKRTPFDSTVWNKKTSGNNTSLYGLMQHILDLVNSKFASNPENTKLVSPTLIDGVLVPTYQNPYDVLTLNTIPNSITAQFSLGYLDIGDLTCAQVLDKLKVQYRFESTFRGSVLQFGFPIYNDQLGTVGAANSSHTFLLRDMYNEVTGLLIGSANIFPSHNLEYSNKDDVILTATVECAVIDKVAGANTFTKSGKPKTKKVKQKVYIYWDIPTQTFKDYIVKPDSKPLSKDIGGEGERHQFFYPVDKGKPNPTYEQMKQLGIEQLYKYHYTGFRGSFSTFGFPFVEWNDNVNILDPIYSDRNGQYKVKKVVYKGGLKGISQDVHVDYRINIPLPKFNKSTIIQ